MQLLNKRLLPKCSSSYVFLLICLLFISGCAQKPWGVSLGEKEYEAGFQLAREMSVQNTQCVKAFHSDLTLEYTNPLGKRTFSGFLQYSPITNYKFVASNPLGQPVIIIAGNNKKYQSNPFHARLCQFSENHQTDPFVHTGFDKRGCKHETAHDKPTGITPV